MAIHFKNNTSAQINLPQFIAFGKDNLNWVLNGDYPVATTSFDFSSNTFSSSSSSRGWLYLNINEESSSPLYGGKLAAGASTVFYRWVAINDTSIPTLNGEIWIGSWTYKITQNMLPARTIEYGKTYHVYTTWDGKNFSRTAPY
jgi:hypothetical protein